MQKEARRRIEQKQNTWDSLMEEKREHVDLNVQGAWRKPDTPGWGKRDTCRSYQGDLREGDKTLPSE